VLLTVLLIKKRGHGHPTKTHNQIQSSPCMDDLIQLWIRTGEMNGAGPSSYIYTPRPASIWNRGWHGNGESGNAAVSV